MKKLIITVLICLLCCVCLYMVNYPVKAATVLTENREGRDGDYTYSLWKDYGKTSMTVKGDVKFGMNVPCTFSKLLNDVIYS